MWDKLRAAWGWIFNGHPKIAAVTDYLVKALTAVAIGAGGYLYYTRNDSSPNPTLSISTEILDNDSDTKLLIIHVRPKNIGKVPVEIGNGVGGFKVTLKKIPNLAPGEWLQPESIPIWITVDILRHHKGGYIIEPGADYDEVEAVIVPNGRYFIEATFDEDADNYINQYHVATAGAPVPAKPK